MLERSKRKPRSRRRRSILAAPHGVQHACSISIPAADPVDDPGEHDLVGLR